MNRSMQKSEVEIFKEKITDLNGFDFSLGKEWWKYIVNILRFE